MRIDMCEFANDANQGQISCNQHFIFVEIEDLEHSLNLPRDQVDFLLWPDRRCARCCVDQNIVADGIADASSGGTVNCEFEHFPFVIILGGLFIFVSN